MLTKQPDNQASNCEKLSSVGLQVKSERAALDQMRAEFENELQQARGEMQRAQDALQGQLLFAPNP